MIDLVIRISEEEYDEILSGIENAEIAGVGLGDLSIALKNGIPLPKGHGALADVKSFIKEVCIGSDDMADDWCDNDCANCEYTDNIRTLFKHIVVEADKEVDE